ncbi:MAG: prepilin-type N-terminal cleavage/methylation domain-containing protein [Planctomycetota bacterium]
MAAPGHGSMGAWEHGRMGAPELRSDQAPALPCSRAPMLPCPHAPTPRSAFTLIELMIVILIVGTLAAAALPTLDAGLDQMSADALAREIATDVRYAQELAIKTGVEHRVAFWHNDQAYAVDRADGDGWTLCEHPVTKKPWRMALGEHSRYAGLRLKDSQFGSSDHLVWDRFGSPESGGSVTFTLGGGTRTVRVAPLSGRITVESE